jgi:hypothetical protein
VQLFNWLLRAQTRTLAFGNSLISNSKDIGYIVEVASSAELILQELEKQPLLELSNIQLHLRKLTLDKFIKISNKAYASEVDRIKKNLQKIKETWEKLNLFPNILKKIGNIIGIKEMIIFEGGIENNVSQLIERLHKEILSLRKIIANGNYKNGVEKEQKLKVIDKVFIRTSIIDLAPKQVNINENKMIFEGIRIAKKISPNFKD